MSRTGGYAGGGDGTRRGVSPNRTWLMVSCNDRRPRARSRSEAYASPRSRPGCRRGDKRRAASDSSDPAVAWSRGVGWRRRCCRSSSPGRCDRSAARPPGGHIRRQPHRGTGPRRPPRNTGAARLGRRPPAAPPAPGGYRVPRQLHHLRRSGVQTDALLRDGRLVLAGAYALSTLLLGLVVSIVGIAAARAAFAR